jgi:hypothetical protein
MKQDADFDPALDRIDIRWFVEVQAACSGPFGELVIEANFVMTLGTYSGKMTPQIMAENINQRGISEGDVAKIVGTDLPLVVGEAALKTRGVRAEDIVSMSIEGVVLDDKTIAETYSRD